MELLNCTNSPRLMSNSDSSKLSNGSLEINMKNKMKKKWTKSGKEIATYLSGDRVELLDGLVESLGH